MSSPQVDINRISRDANLLPPSRRDVAVDQRALSQYQSTQYQSTQYQSTQYQSTVLSREGGHQATNLESETAITQVISPSGPLIQRGYSRATLVRSANYDIDILANLPTSAMKSPVAAHSVYPAPDDGWGFLEQLIGTIEGASDWASQHDYYLYGTPKR